MLIYQTQFLSWLFKVKVQGFRGMLEILLASSVLHLFSPSLPTKILSCVVLPTQEKYWKLHTPTPVCEFEGQPEKTKKERTLQHFSWKSDPNKFK